MRKAVVKAAAAVVVAGFLTTGIGVAGALGIAEIETEGRATFDTIDIAITPVDSGESKLIFGSASVQSTAVVTNEGAPCWVRIKAMLVASEEEAADDAISDTGEEFAASSADASTDTTTASSGDTVWEELEEAGQEASSSWRLAADGYYYLNRILDEGESVEFSIAVRNPYGESWDGSGFDIESLIIAEAIQAVAFVPDFEADAPWGDVEAQACIYARSEGDNHESEL